MMTTHEIIARLNTARSTQIAALAEPMNQAALTAFRAAIDQLGLDDTTVWQPLPHDTRVRAARHNAQALPHGTITDDALNRWIEREQLTRAWARSDGTVIRCTGDAGSPEDWHWLADERAHAARCVSTIGEQPAPTPVFIEHPAPPWLLRGVFDATACRGYQPVISAVWADRSTLLDTLSLIDLRDALAHDRVRVFVGDDAIDQLDASLRERLRFQVVGPVFAGASALRSGTLDERLRRVARDQTDASTRLIAATDQRLAERDPAWWAARYQRAGSNADDPMRALIVTHRHSTFLRHAADDLARGFRSIGWSSHILVEPDDHTNLSTIAYRSCIDAFDPDLIVVANYPRSTRGVAFPKNIPMVCWIQDAMPHLFDHAVGRNQGPLDFITGYVYPKLIREFCYPADRALPTMLAADEHKFHPAELSTEQRRRFECDIAYVSHQAETPQALHDRLKLEAGHAELSEFLDRMREELRRLLPSRWSHEGAYAIKHLPTTLHQDVFGRSPDAAMLARLTDQYLNPMLDRIARHETLEWAADIAREHGLRLKLFGSGWDSHPTLREFAAGPVDHGEDLRACYRAAKIHLHVSSGSLVHQRVMECALSGGMPLCRVLPGNLDSILIHAFSKTPTTLQPVDERGDLLGYDPMSNPALREAHRIVHRSGIPTDPLVWIHRRRIREYRAMGHITAPGHTPDILLDPIEQTTFHDAKSFAQRCMDLITDNDRRREISAQIASVVNASYSYKGLATTFARFVADNLAQSVNTTSSSAA